MAQLQLSEYIEQLKADPHAPNDGSWYVRGPGPVQHDDKAYKAGAKLPQLTNAQVAQLLEVNALTSVAPATQTPANDGGPNQTGNVDPNASGEAGQGSGNTDPNPPSGTTRLDEAGNPVQA